MQHSISRVLMAACAALVLSAPASADDVRLKASVRLPLDAEAVRLADVAEIEGEEAMQYSDLVIAEIASPDDLIELTVRDIRAALDEAGAHWGRINLSGRRVVVRPYRSSVAAPTAMSAVSLEPDPDGAADRSQLQFEDVMASAVRDYPTLRGCVARTMLRGLDVPPDRLRLRFDVDDRDLLASSEKQQQFELKPECSLCSDRVTFTIRMWAGSRVADRAQITLRPLVLTDTAVLLRDLDRDELIGVADLETKPQWLPPSQWAMSCTAREAVGRVATRRLHAGDVLREAHVARPTMIERGDRVTVRCLVGGVVISLQAEARTGGAEGETIELRKLGERATFIATVTGRGEAVVDLSE
jgi:flagella basal body P-ring formation protein FlgA